MLSLLIDSILHIISDLLHVKQLISYHIHFCELPRNAKICRRWWLHSDNFMKVHECFLRRNGTFLKRRIEKRRISWFIKWRDKDPWKTMPNLTLVLKKSSLKNQWTNLGTLVTLVVLILVDYGFCLLSFIRFNWGKSFSCCCFIVMYDQKVWYSNTIFFYHCLFWEKVRKA